MKLTSVAPDGEKRRCPICGALVVCVVTLVGDTFCPACGSQFWVRLPLSGAAQAVARAIVDSGGHIDVDGLTSQWNIDLSGTGVADHFVMRLPQLGSVGQLLLSDLPITDQAVDSLCDMQDLEVLELDGTRVSGDGARRVTAALRRLEILGLADTAVGDAGLALVNRLGNLWCLDLDRTPVTDTGLRQISSCRQLEWLFLNGTQTTDAGLESLAANRSLTRLEVRGTRATIAGCDLLQRRLPRCDIRV